MLDNEGQAIYQAASAAIRAAMEDGRRAGYRGKWLTQAVGEHLMHATVHLEDYQRSGLVQELEHALTRIAMALVLLLGRA